MNKVSQNIFVADDWGLSKEINDAILFLVQRGLVARVSVMANSYHTQYRLDELLKARVETSFHFNLTFGESTFSVPHLMFKPEPQKIEDSFQTQLNHLRTLGVPIKSLESHQYVHCIPSIAKLIAPWCLTESLLNLRFHSDWGHLLPSFFSYYSFQDSYKAKLGFKPLLTQEFRYSGANRRLMVIHPATQNSYDIHDPWREKRVKEFDKIKSLFFL